MCIAFCCLYTWCTRGTQSTIFNIVIVLYFRINSTQLNRYTNSAGHTACAQQVERMDHCTAFNRYTKSAGHTACGKNGALYGIQPIHQEWAGWGGGQPAGNTCGESHGQRIRGQDDQYLPLLPSEEGEAVLRLRRTGCPAGKDRLDNACVPSQWQGSSTVSYQWHSSASWWMVRPTQATLKTRSCVWSSWMSNTAPCNASWDPGLSDANADARFQKWCSSMNEKRVGTTMHTGHTLFCPPLQVAILVRSSWEMSQTVRIDWQYILSRVHDSVRPSEKHPQTIAKTDPRESVRWMNQRVTRRKGVVTPVTVDRSPATGNNMSGQLRRQIEPKRR